MSVESASEQASWAGATSVLLFKIIGFHNAIIMTKHMHFELLLILTSLEVDGPDVSELF